MSTIAMSLVQLELKKVLNKNNQIQKNLFRFKLVVNLTKNKPNKPNLEKAKKVKTKKRN